MKKMITRRQFMAAAGVVAAASASDCLRRFFRKHGCFFCCRFYRRFRCCLRQHHQGGCSGPHDRRCFRLRSGCCQRRKPVHEAGQCQWRCQRQAAGDHRHGRAGRCYAGCYLLYQDGAIRASPLWWAMLPPPRRWQSPLRAPITICPWSPLPLPPRLSPTMPRPTP